MPAFASWHEAHAPALVALERGPRIPVPVVVETYSVLTRLPPPHRVSPEVVHGFLASRFPEAPLQADDASYLPFLEEAVRVGIAGGAVYDAVVAHVARRHDAVLLTRDLRAIPTYERLGAAFERVG